ncbi:hypothetical protein HCN44_005186 [Aphidius gifuensis]|uniref:Uncharacterized protein n=1 Tax=Aphidius gifuensis TaxID=684658 RepID=A0A834XWH8_APHGI|nr:uncharacterized protein LOC122852362 [Aphidius gifuensis]KAF7992842.1 hypothetical protein HCN44_005186 [Aphidius gifuensis]
MFSFKKPKILSVILIIGITLIIVVVSNPIDQHNDISPVMSPLKLKRSVCFSCKLSDNESQTKLTTNLSQKNKSQQVLSKNSLVPEESIRLLKEILPTNEYPPGEPTDDRYRGFIKLGGK